MASPLWRSLLVALVALMVLAAPAERADAQNLNAYGELNGLNFGGGADEPEPEPEPEDEELAGEGDLPDLSAYGEVAEEYKAQSAIGMTQETVGVFRQKLRRFATAAPTYFDDVGETLSDASPTGDWTYFLGVALFTAFLLAIGRAATALYGVYVALPVMRRLQKPDPKDIVDKLPVLAARVGLSIGGIILCLLFVIGVGSGFYQEHEPTLRTVLAIIGAFVMIQLIDVCWRMAISPFLPAYRIPRLTDLEARRLYTWVGASALVGVSSTMYQIWLREMGAPEEVIGLTIIALTLVSVILVFAMVRRNGSAISRALLAGNTRAQAPWPAAVASVLWRPLVLAYMVFAFAEVCYRVIMDLPMGAPLLGSAFAVLLVALVVYAITIYIVARVFRRARSIRELNEEAERRAATDEELDQDKTAIRDALEGVGDEEGGGGHSQVPLHPDVTQPGRKGMKTFEDLAKRLASLFAFGAAVFTLIRIWVGPGAFADGSVYDMIQDLIDIALIGYVIFHAARIWMDQKIEEETGPELELEPGDEGGAAAATSRLGTILPLFRAFVLIVIGASTVLFILMELGVNVAPLFAGAGVVGLAIGFGAQSLVRDILSGVFFLTDDAFRRGEYIDIGDVKGTVEKISLRSFQLRHHLGALNTVPFGEIKFLTNYSRDWVMMKLPLRLTYDTDVDKVRKLVKKLGVKLLDHPTEGHKFVQPLKSQGVYMMEDSAMIIRIKFMTKPGDQWTTRKLVYQEIRNLFEQEGIKFAHKEVTVRIPDLESRDPEDLTPEDRRAIGAAARRAVEEEGAGPAPALAEGR